MSGIYRVQLIYDVLIVANSETHAISVSEDKLREIVSTQEPDYVDCLGSITKRHNVPKPWINCLPYGGDGSSRIEDYIPD